MPTSDLCIAAGKTGSLGLRYGLSAVSLALETSFHSDADSLRRCADVEPVDQESAVHLHGLLADLQLPRDLLVEQTAGHRLKHLTLPRRQARHALDRA